MWKSVTYKEWLKVRWFILIYAGLSFLAVSYLFLRVQHDMSFNEPANYWYIILFKGLKYFDALKFIPLAGGILLAAAQYFPETVSKRIKLTFHLPMNENKVLLQMMLFGTSCLCVVSLILLGFFTAMSTVFFTSDFIIPALITLAPWFLAGFTVYFLLALIILEPVWKYRFLYALVVAAFVPIYFENGPTGATAPVNVSLAILTIILSISLLFSGYRFRKGEM